MLEKMMLKLVWINNTLNRKSLAPNLTEKVVVALKMTDRHLSCMFLTCKLS